MRPIVNMPEDDLSTDIGNMHKKLLKIARVVPDSSTVGILADRQTHIQTDILITILRNRSRSKKGKQVGLSTCMTAPLSRTHHSGGTTFVVV